MKIVQAVVLILVGAAGAILYVKVRGEPQDSPVAVRRELVQPAPDPAPEPAPEPTTAPEATPPPPPGEAPRARVRHEKKPARHAPVVVARNMEPPPVDIQPV